jgi:hypothetical protein
MQTLMARGAGRLIRRLTEGDPVAWSILGGVVVVLIVYGIWKKKSGSA